MSDYHRRMVNIQHGPTVIDSAHYRNGHHDARHAAAEIANEADAEIAVLRARLAEVTYERDGWRDADKAECELTAKLEAQLAGIEEILRSGLSYGHQRREIALPLEDASRVVYWQREPVTREGSHD